MATLTVTTSKDYRNQPNSAEVMGQDITLIDFSTAAFTTATFDWSQFGTPNISNFVTIDGDANSNGVEVYVDAVTFSAADWTFSNWGSGDQVTFRGGAGSDTITGGNVFNAFFSNGGFDDFNGGTAQDVFFFQSTMNVFGASFDGGGGGASDIVYVYNDSFLDFTFSGVTNVEYLTVLGNSEVRFRADQIGDGLISQVSFAGAPAAQILGVFGETIDLGGVGFTGFNAGEGDKVNLLGTAVANAITGSTVDDNVFGGNGGDTINAGDGNDTIFGDSGAAILLGTGNYVQPGNGSNTTFNTATDISNKFSFAANANIANATTVPHVSIVSASRTAPKVEIFKVELSFAGAVISLDIDGTGGSLDSKVEIWNDHGQQLGANDDGPIADPGSATNLDASLNVGVNAPGVYYIIVESAGGQLDADDSYTLHVSIEGEIGTGNDTINGEAGADSIFGDGGNDVINGGSSDDTIDGGTGADQMTGGLGGDGFIVDDIGDRVYESAGGGADAVVTSLNYRLLATSEIEVFAAAAGVAPLTLEGNGYAQTLYGNDGNNRLKGMVGNDSIEAGIGNDYVYGGNGLDSLSGGAGLDSFVFDFAPNRITNVDTIVDYVIADDRFLLDDAAFVGIGATGALGAARFKLGTAATDADDRIIYDAATGKVYFDANGNGAGGQIHFANVAIGTALTAGEFLVF